MKVTVKVRPITCHYYYESTVITGLVNRATKVKATEKGLHAGKYRARETQIRRNNKAKIERGLQSELGRDLLCFRQNRSVRYTKHEASESRRRNE